MPRLSQSLFWIIIHSKAKLSVHAQQPTDLWKPPSEADKAMLLTTNWYDFHQIYALTFKADPVAPSSDPELPLYLSFFFLSPRWFLVPNFDQSIKSCWEMSKSLSTPLIYTPTNSPAAWFLLKQNDPDLLRLIVSRIVEDKIFIPPFSKFILTPEGLTPPLIKPAHFTAKRLNVDPTSKALVKGGHNVCSEAMPQQRIFNPSRDYIKSWAGQGRLHKPVGSCPNIETVSPLLQ